MTNAIVSGIATVKAGRILAVSYGGKTVDIEVDRNIPIVAYAPGTVHMLKRGRSVFILATRRPDGTLMATNVTVESKGVKPPM